MGPILTEKNAHGCSRGRFLHRSFRSDGGLVPREPSVPTIANSSDEISEPYMPIQTPAPAKVAPLDQRYCLGCRSDTVTFEISNFKFQIWTPLRLKSVLPRNAMQTLLRVRHSPPPRHPKRR